MLDNQRVTKIVVSFSRKNSAKQQLKAWFWVDKIMT